MNTFEKYLIAMIFTSLHNISFEKNKKQKHFFCRYYYFNNRSTLDPRRLTLDARPSTLDSRHSTLDAFTKENHYDK